MKYKHETNFIGMMLAVFASLLVIGSIMQLFPKNTMRIIDTTSLYENEITGAVSGMEGVSGFATKYTWTNPKTGAREEDTKPPQSVVYQAEITGVSGQKDKLEYYAVDASKPYKTLVRDSSASQWYAAKTPPSGAIRSPTFDIKNPEKFNIDMDAYVQDTTKRATAKKEEDIAKPLITAAENWKKNPNDIKAKERFDLERKKWDIYRETKTNPSALVSYLGSLDKIEQTVARELIIQRRNDPVVRNALAAEAQSESASESVAELNSLIELEQKVSQFCAKCKIDFNTGQTIDKNDKRPLVFIAGGIGITPFLSIIRDQKHKNFPRRITLFYSNRRPEDTTFKKELESIQHNNFQLICTITNLAESKKKWTKETGRISAGLIKKYITDIKEPVYYIVGLLEMVADMRKMLIDLEVGEEQIKIESFGGYPVRKPAGQ